MEVEKTRWIMIDGLSPDKYGQRSVVTEECVLEAAESLAAKFPSLQVFMLSEVEITFKKPLGGLITGKTLIDQWEALEKMHGTDPGDDDGTEEQEHGQKTPQ